MKGVYFEHNLFAETCALLPLPPSLPFSSSLHYLHYWEELRVGTGMFSNYLRPQLKHHYQDYNCIVAALHGSPAKLSPIHLTLYLHPKTYKIPTTNPKSCLVPAIYTLNSSYNSHLKYSLNHTPYSVHTPYILY